MGVAIFFPLRAKRGNRAFMVLEQDCFVTLLLAMTKDVIASPIYAIGVQRVSHHAH